MVFIASNITTKEVKCTTTLTGLSRELTISYRQLLKYLNNDKLLKKCWFIRSIEPTKCKHKGKF
jgi:hypothetical protein